MKRQILKPTLILLGAIVVNAVAGYWLSGTSGAVLGGLLAPLAIIRVPRPRG